MENHTRSAVPGSSAAPKSVARLVAPAFLAALAVGLLAGCQKSESDGTPVADIRGQPINAPVATGAVAALAVSTPAPPKPAVPTNAPAAPAGDYAPAGFDKLAGYNFEMTDEMFAPVTNSASGAAGKADAQIPATVKAFDKTKAAVKGFMLPLKVEGGLVTELLLLKDQSMCCYGITPKLNEWVSVKMVKDGVKPIMDQPVTMFGTLHVGEMRENGYLVGIYAMDAEKMQAPEEN
jgi:hypothetical protein